MAKTKKPERPVIAREEWDFSDVPDFLTFDCWAYEYSREAMRMGTKLPEVVFDLMPDYRPNKSRPFIKRAGVLRAIETFKNGKGKSGSKDKPGAMASLERRIYKRGYDLTVSVGPMKGRANLLLSIDWEMGATALANDFKELMGRLRKNSKLKTKRGGMPAQIQQRFSELKGLGALRILNAGFTAHDAASMTQRTCGVSLYQAESRWSSAKTGAKNILSVWPFPLTGNIFHPDSPGPVALAKRQQKAARRGR